ncbi:MAG: 1-acyl-sn-glycerol-3-phosphate acyltransferase [Clostridia bacterium]|nr:1-acyl-sn-glycerol-3-phosphate acyltransferase [Clostridia bacterium]
MKEEVITSPANGKKRENYEKRQGIQDCLESHRRFDYDYIPFGEWTIPDGNYPYRKKGWARFETGLCRTITQIFGPLVTWFSYGTTVRGRKNIRALGRKQGAICISNHFMFLDNLILRQALGFYRSFHTMTYHNNRGGFLGWVMKHSGMLPFSPDREAMRCMNNEMERLLKKGKLVNFYAERAMWENYQKPRPLKEGAFHYAVKFNVPVVPVFCTFKKTKKRGWARWVVVHILPPVFINEDLPKKERIADLKARTEQAWKECYEKVYRKPLEYLPDVRKNSHPSDD